MLLYTKFARLTLIKLTTVCKQKLRINRNLTAEKILETLPIPCSFSVHGCTEHLMNIDLSKHESECQFREVQCPKHMCMKRTSVPHLIEHIAEHKFSTRQNLGSHSALMNVREELFTSAKRQSLYCLPTHLQIHGKHFFVMKKLNQVTISSTFYVQLFHKKANCTVFL